MITESALLSLLTADSTFIASASASPPPPLPCDPPPPPDSPLPPNTPCAPPASLAPSLALALAFLTGPTLPSPVASSDALAARYPNAVLCLGFSLPPRPPAAEALAGGPPDEEGVRARMGANDMCPSALPKKKQAPRPGSSGTLLLDPPAPGSASLVKKST